MPSSTFETASIPEWQSHVVFASYARQLNIAPSDTTERPLLNRTSMFGSFKSKFARKNNARSTSSQDSVEEVPRAISPSFRTPVELAATASPTQQALNSDRERSPLGNPSPATRRPNRAGMNAFTVPSNEPPPAYTPSDTGASRSALGPSPPYTAPARGSSPSPSVASAQQEDPYIFLTQFDTILLIDDSGSMAGRSWRETSQALSRLLPIIVAHDADGIDIYFLNHISSDPGSPKDGIAPGGYRNVKDVAEVERIFKAVKPGGGTPTGTRCRAIMKPYLSKLDVEAQKGKIDDVKPLNILAITDGVPSDDVESVLISAAKKLDALDAAPHQVGFQFFQVGNEEGAAEALRELDDGLVGLVQGGVRDMVDTCTWMGGASADGTLKLTAEGILKVCLGSVVKRLDRRRLSGEMRRLAVG